MDELQLDRRALLSGAVALGGAGLAAGDLHAQSAVGKKSLSGIIDVHAHNVLPSWRRWIEKKYAPKPPEVERAPVPEWSPASALELMDQNNIQTMVLSHPIGTKGMTREEAVRISREMNEELATLIGQKPKRFGGFAVLPQQNMDDMLKELEYALDTLHLDGACILSSFEGIYPGDPSYEPLIAELDRRRTTLFVHPIGAEYVDSIKIPVRPAMMEFLYDTCRAVVSLVNSGMRKRYPNFSYIATHAGGPLPMLAPRIAGFAGAKLSPFTGPRFAEELSYEEVMSGIKSICYDLAGSCVHSTMVSLRQIVPPDQILMGTDWPYAPTASVAPSLAAFASSGVFDAAESQKIINGNALRIMPSLAKRLGA